MSAFICLLPGGYIDADGVRQRQVQLKPLNGEAEARAADGKFGPNLVSQLLASSIVSVGPHRPTQALVRQLLVADRQYLLLKLRTAMQGDVIRAVLYCPQPACYNKMDIDFAVDDIPVNAVERLQATYQAEIGRDAVATATGDATVSEHTAHFRLPNGSDQEAIVPLLDEDRDQEAGLLLLQRCLQRIGIAAAEREMVARLPDAACAKIEKAMAAMAPRVELTMEGICPECERTFAVPFDLETFILQELRTSMDALSREVHYLAYHYNWSEREIMEMPRTKRRRYIEVLAKELEKQPYAV